MTHRDPSDLLVVAQSLRASYEAADYEVVGSGSSVSLRIGAPAPRVTLEGGRGWLRVAIITAWNPFSAPEPVEVNDARQALLQREVERAGRSWLPALGRDPAGEWAPEPSIAVFDASDDELDEWMLAFGQNAVVVAAAGASCALRCHPHERARVEVEGAVAERAAARLFARAWNTREPDLCVSAMHDDVVYTSLRDGAALAGRAAVREHLCGALQSRGAWASVDEASEREPGRPCAVLHRGDATTPTDVVHFTLRRGSIARIDVRALT